MATADTLRAIENPAYPAGDKNQLNLVEKLQFAMDTLAEGDALYDLNFQTLYEEPESGGFARPATLS